MPSDTPDPNDPLDLGRLLGGDILGQLQRLMSWTGGPVNWDLADEVAGAAASNDPEVTTVLAEEVAQAGRLAELWLDPLTPLPGAGADPAAWTRRTWLQQTRPAWRQLVEPVAGRVTDALGAAFGQVAGEGLAGEGLPPEFAALLGGGGAGALGGMMRQVGGVAFGAQVGQALGALAGEVLSSSEIGLPLGPSALLPANVATFADGLSIPLEQVRLYLALREAAHQRLFTHVPWLRSHLFDAVDAFARGIELDLGTLERAVENLDLTDPAAAQEALAGGLFTPTTTPSQQAALDRLETALALVEGWVDHVVDAAAAPRLPQAGALREAIRRRRASGGPAEQTFSSLVGLQLRPRRLREAAALWARITELSGIEGRDALWLHPDLLPGAADLDEPMDWGAKSPEPATDWDAGLRALDLGTEPGRPSGDDDPAQPE